MASPKPTKKPAGTRARKTEGGARRPRKRTTAAKRPGMSDAVRRAVEKTVQSTVGSAAMTRERAQDLVDDVVRRAEQGAARAGRGVREAGQRQAEAAVEVGDRLRDAILDRRVATREDIRRMGGEIERLAARVDRLDREIRGLRGSKTTSKSRPASKRGPAPRRKTATKSKRRA